MKAISIITKSNTHLLKDGVLNVKSDRLVPMKGADGRMILRYYFDCSFNIPVGTIGLILPPVQSGSMSLSQVGAYYLLPGLIEEPYIEYKINTDAIPAVYESNDYCASIIFLPIVSEYPGFLIETVIKSDPETTKDEPSTEEPKKEEQADVNQTLEDEHLPESEVETVCNEESSEAAANTTDTTMSDPA